MSAHAQEPEAPAADAPAFPTSAIYIAELGWSDGIPSVDAIVVPDHGPEGYVNQPYFCQGSKLYFYSASKGGNKTDIYMGSHGVTTVDIQVTDTPDRSEYSPKCAPEEKTISFIQESPDASLTTLNQMRLSEGEGEQVITLAPLGYYAWFNDGADVAVFLRSNPATLFAVNVETDAFELIAENIGRALFSSPDGKDVYFTTAIGEGDFQVNKYSSATKSIDVVRALPSGSQDYAVFAGPDGDDLLLSASGNILYMAPATSNGDWLPLEGFDIAEKLTVNRLAISSDLSTLAFVVAEVE
ncbi:MAG: hypothetical protein AAFX02_06410 [Pseudomonadota bacterium]